MILECPNCHARFLVADAQIPYGGRTVRCGACAHQWPVERDGAVPDEPPPEPVPETAAAFVPETPGINVPALAKRRISAKPFKIAVPVLALAWLVLAFYAYFPAWQHAPVVSNVYRALGVTPTEGLLFADVHMEKGTTEDGKMAYILSGSVVNHAGVTRSIPSVRVALKDKKGKVIWSREYAVNVELKAGEVYPFRISDVETSFADNVATVVIDVGHSLQLLMRG